MTLGPSHLPKWSLVYTPTRAVILNPQGTVGLPGKCYLISVDWGWQKILLVSHKVILVCFRRENTLLGSRARESHMQCGGSVGTPRCVTERTGSSFLSLLGRSVTRSQVCLVAGWVALTVRYAVSFYVLKPFLVCYYFCQRYSIWIWK